MSKSQALWLASKRHCTDTPFNVVWPKEPVNALGVFFSYDDTAAERVNFDPRLKKLKSILNIWKMRHLTLSGKIILIKTFALSQFTFLASCIHVPNQVIQEVESIVFDFLWNGGNGLVIKRATIVGDIEDGGLKMVGVKSMFKALRVKWTQTYTVA